MSNARFGLRVRNGLVRGITEGFAALDADALAFIAAAGITDATQQTAINTLVVELKTFGLWAKMKAIYPFVGGTASSHKFNLKDSRDLDAAFRLVFSGGLTHSSNGILPNGSNGFVQTYLTPSSSLISANSHLSYYSRTNNANAIDFDMGVGDSLGGYSFSMFLRRSNSTAGFDSGNAISNNRITASSQTNSQGFYIGSIRSSTDRILIKNGTNILASSTLNNSNILPDSQIFLFAYNERPFGTPGNNPQFYGSKECAFASIGDGLTNTEAANFYTAVQSFQTTLGRQV